MESTTTNDMTTILLPSSVSADILEFLIAKSKRQYQSNKSAFYNFVLDLSQIKYIDVEGALSLICFCAAIKRKNKSVNFRFIYPNENVLSYLTTLGFFTQMSNKIGGLEGQNIVHYENELRQSRRIRQKHYSSENRLLPIILPIETINQKTSSNSGSDFDNIVGTFANQALDSFDDLETTPHYKFNGEDYFQFRLSNIELYKNIFHHSKSWGIATIHARPHFGTTVSYFDIGIGFKESVGKFNSEEESIIWALKDGNTSKEKSDNDGFGLTHVQEFVFKRKGTIKIRSGDCQIELTSPSGIKKSNVGKFPGVQITFFIPV